MAYASDKKPGELTALTTLATDDVIIVGDTSDASEVAKHITKANLITDLTTSFAPVLGADDNYVTDAEKAIIAATTASYTTAEATKVGHISITQAVDLDALETASHAAVTVADSAEIDLTLTGQQISAAIVAGSIDETKLDVSVNASLDLADSALQPSVYDAQTILAATADNTPAALTVTEQTVVGRATGGNIAALAIDSDLSSVSANDDTIPSAKATKAALDLKLANVVEDTTPQLGGALDCNGQNVTDVQELRLDATPDADHTAVGLTTNSILSGATVAAFNSVYLGSGGKWVLTDASATATADALLAIALEAKNDTEAMLVALPGSIIRDDTLNLTIGGRIFLSESAGSITQTAPSTTDSVVRVIGYAITADSFFFLPEGGVVHV